MSESTIPRQARRLGLAGLVPSAAALAVMLAWPAGRDMAAGIGLAYGAVVASVVGGSWWGLAAARAAPGALGRYLQLAIMPGLVAWLAVMAPPAPGLAALALLFAVLPPTDRRLLADGIAPAWWVALRRPLSFAMAALLAAASLVLVLSPAG
jgi:hypothetical protein